MVANSACRRLLGLPPSASLAGRPVEELAAPDDREAVRRRMRELEGVKGATARFIWRLQRSDEGVVELEGVSSPVVHRGQSAIQVVLRDHAREAQAAESPLRDALTGLSSLALVERPPGRVAIAQAYRHRARVGVLRVDLDAFRKVERGAGQADRGPPAARGGPPAAEPGARGRYRGPGRRTTRSSSCSRDSATPRTRTRWRRRS